MTCMDENFTGHVLDYISFYFQCIIQLKDFWAFSFHVGSYVGFKGLVWAVKWANRSRVSNLKGLLHYSSYIVNTWQLTARIRQNVRDHKKTIKGNRGFVNLTLLYQNRLRELSFFTGRGGCLGVLWSPPLCIRNKNLVSPFACGKKLVPPLALWKKIFDLLIG